MEDQKQKDIEKLIRLCETAVEKYGSKDVTGDGIPETFCNHAVQYITSGMGYSKLGGLMANDIVDFLLVSKDWARCDGVLAQGAANNGKLAIAALKDSPHGHVAVCYPGGLTRSGKWQKAVPMVANVGKENFIKGANFAFREEPMYFVLNDLKEE